MLKTVNITKTIALPADQAWAAIAQIDGLERWFSMITDCTAQGTGADATRIITLANGDEIIDKIETIDHQSRRLTYNRIKSPFPVNSYLGSVYVHAFDPNTCEITWSVELDVSNEQHDELICFLKDVLTEGIDGLERDLLSSTNTRQTQEHGHELH